MMHAKRIATFSLLLLITACVSMPLGSMWKLRNLDVLSTDPAELRIAVITDKLVQLQDGSTTLAIGFSSELAEHTFNETLLATIKANAQVSALSREIQANQALTLFYLAEPEAEKLRLAQNRIQAIRDQGIDGNGSLSIGIRTGCFAEPPPNSLTANIFAQFDAAQGYIKMQSDLDLMDIARRANQDIWVQC